MTKHVSWTEIESFYNVRKLLSKYPELANGNRTVAYKAKVKLHGTCAGVRVDSDGKVTAMSRSMIVTPEHDNQGFAKWVKSREDKFTALAPKIGSFVVFGEWCGPGVQKGVAVNKINERIFAVFGVRLVDLDDKIDENMNFVYEPEALGGLLAFLDFIPGMYVLPWYNDGELFSVDWATSAEDLQPVIDRINAYVKEVEDCDPWVSATFGQEGVGEGLVFYPVSSEHQGYKNFSNLCFKAKGEKHQVVAKTKPAQADPTVAANLEAFADMVITPARLEQGVRAVSNGELVFEQKNIGQFLAWINKDVTKEAQAEIEAAGLNQRDAIQAACNKARGWYVTEMKKL